MYEPRQDEPPEKPLRGALASRTVLVARSPGAEPVAERLRAAGWTVVWTAPPSARRAAGDGPPGPWPGDAHRIARGARVAEQTGEQVERNSGQLRPTQRRSTPPNATSRNRIVPAWGPGGRGFNPVSPTRRSCKWSASVSRSSVSRYVRDRF